MIVGKVVANEASPVSTALPVVSSTNQGTARSETMFPVTERALAASKVMYGRLTRNAPGNGCRFSVAHGWPVVK
ncbi:hypothetical protein GCM10022224_062450 [Nonomuraea antimicrobica]|uniref:Uncharacterized protein n=1 Tax=Nonomuraea antimicrobica TaxID=561173 RepID=A0ABP7CH11_9ACTN